ncbi:SMI1/KNR4 family protein [Streptomyces sp. NPDC051994]|uniref:SMI1/KNR4 family protein n=1 Tax=unclassified Streptomyces TaxID=2593676 RepID=UPI0034295C83
MNGESEMSNTSRIAEIVGLMPPHDGAGYVADWMSMERAWGLSFPNDFKAFVAAYGDGSMENYLAVLVPEEAGGEPAGDVADTTDDARATWEETGPPPGSSDSPEQLVAWGADGTGDLLCWLTEGGDPDQWPVAVYHRGYDAWRIYPCSMTDFLYRMFCGEWDEHPLSGTPLWGNRSPRFLTHEMARSIRQRGGEPWPEAQN